MKTFKVEFIEKVTYIVAANSMKEAEKAGREITEQEIHENKERYGSSELKVAAYNNPHKIDWVAYNDQFWPVDYSVELIEGELKEINRNYGECYILKSFDFLKQDYDYLFGSNGRFNKMTKLSKYPFISQEKQKELSNKINEVKSNLLVLFQERMAKHQ